jgi:hypothetical protein
VLHPAYHCSSSSSSSSGGGGGGSSKLAVSATHHQQQQHCRSLTLNTVKQIASTCCCYCHWLPVAACWCPCSVDDPVPCEQELDPAAQGWVVSSTGTAAICAATADDTAIAAVSMAATAATAALMRTHLSSQSQSLISTRMPGRLQGQGHNGNRQTSLHCAAAQLAAIAGLKMQVS